jgi:DNA mismatch endonuclease (patch repair protein)
MADTVNKATRSRMMAKIGGKNTKPEMTIRRALHARGFRFRLHVASMPGRPDIVLPKYRAVILVHGCFWHRHSGCRYSTTPATRPEFWLEKFQQNVKRDQRTLNELRALGWRVATAWECDIRNGDKVVEDLIDWLVSERQTLG